MAADQKPDGQNGVPRVRVGPIEWLSSSLRTAVEDAVSGYTGRAWRITTEKDFSEFACHRVAVVSDSSFAVFFKYSEAVEAKRQFEVEISNLKILSDRAGVFIPRPVGIVTLKTGTVLIMEAVEAIERGRRQWREIGATLARIHRVEGDRFGLERHGFWGPLHQDNTPGSDWPTFFRERRLLPLLKIAVESGNLPAPVTSQVERLTARLPELCGPGISPSLLHGDAQQNNFISAVEGAFVIDPAVYYGHPEMDLALLDSFQPVPEDVFDGYRELLPIGPGFPRRRDLWRVPLYLAAVALEGPMHINRLTDALKSYL